jgi:hypothetical protein
MMVMMAMERAELHGLRIRRSRRGVKRLQSFHAIFMGSSNLQLQYVFVDSIAVVDYRVGYAVAAKRFARRKPQ